MSYSKGKVNFKNLSIKDYTVLLAAAYFGLPGGFMLKSSDRE